MCGSQTAPQVHVHKNPLPLEPFFSKRHLGFYFHIQPKSFFFILFFSEHCWTIFGSHYRKWSDRGFGNSVALLNRSSIQSYRRVQRRFPRLPMLINVRYSRRIFDFFTAWWFLVLILSLMVSKRVFLINLHWNVLL